ncbi:hypothetical protein HID58_093131 [Brassica napus]|uniref:Uncharacterized protein n=1 Tax=Brassica napus TaxID=3708 RepID=A0ABQ7XC44_BRANA|nr:hypothetical protein HID58_093131 [Brassica napus]
MTRYTRDGLLFFPSPVASSSPSHFSHASFKMESLLHASSSKKKKSKKDDSHSFSSRPDEATARFLNPFFSKREAARMGVKQALRSINAFPRAE